MDTQNSRIRNLPLEPQIGVAMDAMRSQKRAPQILFLGQMISVAQVFYRFVKSAHIKMIVDTLAHFNSNIKG